MLQAILVQIGNTVIGLITTAVCAGIFWLLTLRYRSEKIRALLKNPQRQFDFYYRGSESPDKKKRLTFNESGEIGEGRNSNEYKSEVGFGALRIFNDQSKLYSKFRWDKEKGRLIHTNDPALPSVLGQYIVPLFIKPGHF